MQHPKPSAEVAERDRLDALDGYAVLDTPAEPGFDGIVVLARAVCAAPIALVSLVAQDRQWFKARSGLVACGTALDASICKHVVGMRDTLVIPDLTRDPRTRGNPLVTGVPHIRFYAGAPLITPDGHGLGALCVIDTEPRPDGLTEEQRECLQVLAGLVMTHLGMRQTLIANGQS
ncbi:GAF domain-containing protein [Methylobacterium sp. J-048]|uniref:GAF domain-containing protein n=1 Tax=Methylobacterium sp. J-048 TaxID=2836635 RepID=UPI001FBA634D|nr:GAF domain-containing protein [Methylobacterium sp. J-048]MCJ2060061.1 GAF domain-containing protein [Methylobacterium sp. J-048]